MNRNPIAGRTIKKDLLIVLPLSILLPSVLIMGLFLSSIRKIIDRDVVAYQEVIVNQERDSLENIFAGVNIIQRSIIGKIITDYTPPGTGERLSREDVRKLKELIEYLYTVAQAYKFINGVYIVYENNYVISSRNGIREHLLLDRYWIDIARQSNGEELIVKPHPAAYNVGIERESYDTVISSVQKFFMPDIRKNPILIQIDIDLSAFNNFIHSVTNTEQVPMYIYNSFTNSSLLENEIYASYGALKDRKEIYISKPLKGELLYLRAFIPRDRMLLKFRSAILSTTAVIAAILVLGVFMVILFSGRITGPLQALYVCMQQVGRGDFSVDYPSTHYQELKFLIGRFKTMVEEVDRLIETVVRKENEASEAELQALQAKINPHFLYNTLDVIRSIALEHGNADISEMTLSLSRLFRYNVGNLQETTTIQEELRYLKDYLKIQRYRFGDRIRVDFDIPASYSKVRMARFILQPIVENAFKYGLELVGKGGRLRISARESGGDLELELANNGPVPPPERISEIREIFRLEPSIGRVKSAHGLANVDLRLKLLYGNRYGLDMRTEGGAWTILTIRIPLVREDSDV